MASLPAILMSVLYLNQVSGYVLLGDDDNEIVWPTEYHMKGEKINFITTLKEPFEFWYSANLNRSRADLNGGTTKKYFFADEGYAYMIYPMAWDTFKSEEICDKMSTEDEQEDFMPDVSYLTFTGQSMTILDKSVDVWTGKEDYEDKMIREMTLYVYKTQHGYDVPVQQTIKILNLDTGELRSHVIVNYYNFKDSASEEDLSIDDDSCNYKGPFGQDFKTDILALHPDIPRDLDIAFESYMNHHSKVYHEKEVQKRKHIFEENWRMVNEHNRKNLGFRLELNEFSDKTEEELHYLTGTFVPERPVHEVMAFPFTQSEVDDIVQELPENFDLRIEGVVTPVKNQAACGSCWAFCTTAAVEGAIARATGDRLLDLSEQSLVDCAWKYNNMGCSGGTLEGALKYVLDNGIPTERDYGLYMASNGYCDILNMTSPYTIKGFTLVTPRSPNALKVALYKYGPVTVAIHASKLMKHYASGLFYDFSCADARVNHGVTVVGYGVRNGEDYWLVKNSWGEAWGEDGYILMAAKNDNCFLLDTPYSPIV